MTDFPFDGWWLYRKKQRFWFCKKLGNELQPTQIYKQKKRNGKRTYTHTMTHITSYYSKDEPHGLIYRTYHRVLSLCFYRQQNTNISKLTDKFKASAQARRKTPSPGILNANKKRVLHHNHVNKTSNIYTKTQLKPQTRRWNEKVQGYWLYNTFWYILKYDPRKAHRHTSETNLYNRTKLFLLTNV